MNLENGDFQALLQIGQSLWEAPERQAPRIEAAFVAASLKGQGRDATVERAAAAVLDRADRDGPVINQRALNNPFFRLLPEERLILCALHQARWSYARIGRVLGRTTERVAQVAWNLRLHLSPYGASHATGSPYKSTQCPEYVPQDPWTQRFLDREIPPAERVFLEGHLHKCESCRSSLERCRKIYYSVERQLPAAPDTATIERQVLEISRLWNQSRTLLDTSPTFRKSVEILLRKHDVRWVLGIAAALIVARFFF